jgi:hypothetical protein
MTLSEAISTMDRDIISIQKPDGKIIDEVKANVQPEIIFIHDEKIPLEENDKIYRKLPNGLVEVYIVLDRGYYAAFHQMPGHYQAKVRKEGSINNEQYKSTTNVFNVNGHNSRVNINSIDNSVNSIDTCNDLFEEIKQELNKIKDVTIKTKSLEMIKELEETKNTKAFGTKYQKFIEILSNHISIISPFIPALTRLINFQ